MKNVFLKFVWVVSILLAISSSGCISGGSSPQSHFYTLQALSKTEIPGINKDAIEEMIIGIGPVEIPGFLNRPQIVTRSADNELHFAEFQRWAEPLEESIERSVAENLTLIFPQAHTVLYPWSPSLNVKYSVIMEILRLEAQLENEAVLVVNWSVLEAEKKRILLTKQSTYRSPVIKPDYSSLVGSYSRLIAMLSAEMAQAIGSLASGGG